MENPTFRCIIPFKVSNPDGEYQNEIGDEFKLIIARDSYLYNTVIGGENPVAVINDKFVYTGDRIGDYEVITIGKDEVVLKSDTHNVVLRILKIAEM